MEKFTINRLGLQGDGIADGPIYAARTLPGERVTGEVVGDRIISPRIETPSDNRVSPPCRHFKACGGCQLQHASDPFVADWKNGVVRHALAARGIDAELRPIQTSPARSRRRAVFSVKRTKSGAMVGFHAPSSAVVIDVPECQLIRPELRATMPALQELAVVGGSRKAELSVTVTHSEGGADILVRGGKPLDGPLQIALAHLAEKHDLARLAWEDEVIVTRRAPAQRFGRALVAPPPGTFLQATIEGEAALLAAVQEAVGDAKRVVDLFSGCGTFSLPLAEAAEVHAVEGEPAMIKALDAGWRQATGLKRVSHEARDLFRRPLTPDEFDKFDAVVVDPPRAGAEAQVEQLLRSKIKRLAMVSCNPVTFGRDAQALAGVGFNLDWVQVVDQFRWSTHVELVAQFSRA